MYSKKILSYYNKYDKKVWILLLILIIFIAYNIGIPKEMKKKKQHILRRGKELSNKFIQSETTSLPIDRPLDGNFRVVLMNLYSQNCGHSQRFLPVWEKLSDFYSSDPNIDVIKIDIDQHRDISNSLNVTQVPTVMLQTNNKYIKYKGDRSINDLITFTNRYR